MQLGLGNRLAIRSGALLPEVLTYAGNLAAAGATISSSDLAALNTWAVRGTTAGWLPKLKEIWPMMGSTLAGAAVKMRYGAGAQASLDVSRLVSGDYSQANGLGMTTRSATKYVTTGFTPSLDSLSLANFSCVTTNLDATLYKALIANYMGDTPASGQNKLVFGQTNNNNSSSPRGDIGSQGYSAYLGVNGPACHVMNWGSNSQQVFRNGWQMYYATDAISGTLDSEINIGRIRSGGVYYVDVFRLGLTAFGGVLTTAEATDLGQATYEFQRSISRTLLSGSYDLFVGDSITAGQGANTFEQSFQYLIANTRGKKPLCFGNPGAQTRQDSSARNGIYQQRTALANYSPSRIYFMAGTNDAQYDGVLNGNATVAADFKAKLKECVQLWQGYGHEVILMTLCYSTNTNINTTKQDMYATAVLEAASETGAGVVNINALMRASSSPTPAAMMADATHPNATGHSFIATSVAAAYP